MALLGSQLDARIQAIGGGMASAASQKVNGDPDKGGHVMLIGIIIQLIEMVIYILLAANFFRNYPARRALKDHRTKGFSRGINAVALRAEHSAHIPLTTTSKDTSVRSNLDKNGSELGVNEG
ncbi:hypothetical protein DL93DRAFT_2165385 [Clavulina sp. PMI_390]|nr:hypothetical protein DL93DRAFT_2165385 [Clavulina sp. PMI_390]